ncbi:hypothetical protein NHX12_006481 [Muraenolepis orangiensis]|uniref:Uncharacterized protein n=1 Tax=Muraenolepis orangiensis TaxID=630683 RepID=A0A9Q0DTC6_9TELE|nr:hypothetical protein NHX12_006481 [Muraenolepis orangiensis]
MDLAAFDLEGFVDSRPAEPPEGRLACHDTALWCGLTKLLYDYSNTTITIEDNTRLLYKVEDLENRSRRSNLRIVGIPKKTEAQDPVSFMLSFFAEILGSDFFPTPPVLDRANRIGPASADKERNWPRVFIVCFHYHRDKGQVARRRGEQLYFRGNKVIQDHSANTARKRSAFNAVKGKLHEKKVKFGIQMPALRLWVVHDGTRVFFDSPEQAQTFYDRHFT